MNKKLSIGIVMVLLIGLLEWYAFNWNPRLSYEVDPHDEEMVVYILDLVEHKRHTYDEFTTHEFLEVIYNDAKAMDYVEREVEEIKVEYGSITAYIEQSKIEVPTYESNLLSMERAVKLSIINRLFGVYTTQYWEKEPDPVVVYTTSTYNNHYPYSGTYFYTELHPRKKSWYIVKSTCGITIDGGTKSFTEASQFLDLMYRSQDYPGCGSGFSSKVEPQISIFKVNSHEEVLEPGEYQEGKLELKLPEDMNVWKKPK